MKDAFKRELKLLIESEIKQQRRETKHQTKLEQYAIRTEKLNEESKKLEEAKKIARQTDFQMRATRNHLSSSRQSNGSSSVRKINELATSQRSFMQKFGNDLESTGRTSIVVRLRQANEEKTLRSMEIQELNRETQEEKHRQQKLTQLYTDRKLDEFEKKRQSENQAKV